MTDLLHRLNPVPDAPLTAAEQQVADDLLASLVARPRAHGQPLRWLIPVAAVGLVTAGVLGSQWLRPPTTALAPGSDPSASTATQAAIAACKAEMALWDRYGDPASYRSVFAERRGGVTVVVLQNETKQVDCHTPAAGTPAEPDSAAMSSVTDLPANDPRWRVGARDAGLDHMLWGPSGTGYLLAAGAVGDEVVGVVLDTGTQRITAAVFDGQVRAWTDDSDFVLPTGDGAGPAFKSYKAGLTFDLTFTDGTTAVGVPVKDLPG